MTTMTLASSSTAPTTAAAAAAAAAELKDHHGVELLTEDLEKSLPDKRSYRVVRLTKNNLEVLLVHDPDSDKASAAMDVNVGNFCDDDDMPGLAHAVEHVGCVILRCAFFT